RGGDRRPEKDDQRSDDRGRRDQREQQRGVEIARRVLFDDKTEISIVQPEQRPDIDEGGGGINQAHFAKIGGSPELGRQVGGQQLNEEFGENGTCSIPDRLTRQFFNTAHLRD